MTNEKQIYHKTFIRLPM